MSSVPRSSIRSPFLGKASQPERRSLFAIKSTYNSPGPYKPEMHKWIEKVSPLTLPTEERSTTSARDRKIGAKIWYPTAFNGGQVVPNECPLVLFTNGFRMLSEFYTEYAEHLASWGYVAAQYDLITCKELNSPFEIVDDATLVDYFRLVRPTVEQRLRNLDVNINIPKGQTGVAGHSRGGKVSALIGTDYKNLVKSMFLIDPVDNVKSVRPPSEKYPSAVDALKKGNFQLGIAGSSVCGFCNPSSCDYQQFYDVAAKGSWLVQIPQAGHMQFLAACWPVQIALNLLCFFGATSNKKVIPLTKAFMVAWFERTLKTEFPLERTLVQEKGYIQETPNQGLVVQERSANQETLVQSNDSDDGRMKEFLEWAKKEQAMGAIDFEIKE